MRRPSRSSISWSSYQESAAETGLAASLTARTVVLARTDEIGPSPDREGHPVVRLLREPASTPAGRPRIVSLVPSLTELICDLGLADCLVGRTAFCIHPQAALARVPRVGGTKTPKIDRILEQSPTHLIVNVDENDRATVETLAQSIPQVVVTHPIEIEDHFELFSWFGERFSCEREATALSAALSRVLDRQAAKRYDERQVVYYIWKDPWMTVASDTFIARMLARVGLRNVTFGREVAGPRYPEWPLERLDDPHIDAVLLSSEPCRFGTADRREVLRRLDASPTRRPRRVPVLGIDGEMCSWYGSRIVRALDQLDAYRERLDRRIHTRTVIRSAHARP